MTRIARMFAPLIGVTTPLAGFPANSMEQLSDGELDHVRGGYVSAGGFTFDFGALLQTFVDGRLALESSLSLTSAGTTTSVIIADRSDAEPLDAASVSASGVDLAGTHGRGVAIEGIGGVTTLIQDLSQNAIRNLVINTAQDRNILQNTSITITMPNLIELQQGIAAEQIGTGLRSALDLGLIGAASH